jgi:hypothetical protein
MIDGEIRGKVKYQVVDILQIVCQKVFGYQPKDLTISWPSLRILNSLEEEQVKNHQFNRVTSAYQMGAIDRPKWAEAINKDNLLPVEVDENDEALPPIDGEFLVGEGNKVDN